MRTFVIFLATGGAVLAPPAIAIGAAQFTTPAPMSLQAKAYLDHAITLFQQQHINSAKMDWSAVTSKSLCGGRRCADDGGHLSGDPPDHQGVR